MDASLRYIERTMADHLRVSVIGTGPEALASELMQLVGPMVIAYREQRLEDESREAREMSQGTGDI